MSANKVLQAPHNNELSQARRKPVKLLIWDLDNTLWEGILLEDSAIRLREGVRDILAILDKRGILHSIASKNDNEVAMDRLCQLGLDHYFLYPQVNWNCKAANIQSIVTFINIGMDAVAFIDDDPFERQEVHHSLPEVLVLDAADLENLVRREEFTPPFITADSAQRRYIYQADMRRKKAEEEFVGPKEEFLASLNMKLMIDPACLDDLQRAEELTVRTHQLNSTGYTYSYDELNAFRSSSDHLLLIASLIDKFGDYGKIGLVLVEKKSEIWTVKLLLMSCRVMSRGVGTILMNQVLMLARQSGVRLHAEFCSNNKNRMMLMAYKFGGFRELNRAGDFILFEHDLQQIQSHPDWIDLKCSYRVPDH